MALRRSKAVAQMACWIHLHNQARTGQAKGQCSLVPTRDCDWWDVDTFYRDFFLKHERTQGNASGSKDFAM